MGLVLQNQRTIRTILLVMQNKTRTILVDRKRERRLVDWKSERRVNRT
ncbi:uncharacterized protein G2W53_044431 [Senna tora]|uniref:Uncharacterized protein n=1 Tax=Senna tora TaxID=362788 RepID=A0A834SEX2_9FABA|nr:uncharacterized protein G2W53_044431 [Senna tora]